MPRLSIALLATLSLGAATGCAPPPPLLDELLPSIPASPAEFAARVREQASQPDAYDAEMQRLQATPRDPAAEADTLTRYRHRVLTSRESARTALAIAGRLGVPDDQLLTSLRVADELLRDEPPKR